MLQPDNHELRRSIAWAIALSLVRSMYEVRHVVSAFYKAHPHEFQVLAIISRNEASTLQHVATTFHSLVTAMGAIEELGLLSNVFPSALSLEIQIASEDPDRGGSDDFLGMKIATELANPSPRSHNHEAELAALDWQLASPPLSSDAMD